VRDSRTRVTRFGDVAELGVAPVHHRHAERLAEFRSRRLDDRRWLIWFVDGFDFTGHTWSAPSA
jgi:hypothetical protein